MKRQLSKSISQVIAMLDAFPQMQSAVVFGSLLDRPEEAKDVDIAFAHPSSLDLEVLNRFLPVVQLASYGSPRYGSLDVFVAFDNALMVRDDDSNGFTRAKQAQELRRTIQEQGVPWGKWRQTVALHPDVSPAADLPRTVYFAHPISTYCTDAETRAIDDLEAAGLVVVNPSQQAHQEACGNDMVKWAALAATCDGVAFMAFPDGAIGAGVVKEVEAVLAQGKPVYQVSYQMGGVRPVQNWPGKRRLLTVEETRERINPFRQERQERGLSPIPVRPEPAAPKSPRP